MTDTLKQEIMTRAPHVDAAWADEFILELRLRGASGAAIGAALMEVESHMADHQGSIEESFGAPAAYAESLELPDTQQWTRKEAATQGVKGFLGVVGIYLLLGGIISSQSQVSIPLIGLTVLVMVNLLAVAALIKWDEAILRFLLKRIIVSSLIGGVLVALVVVATFIPGPTLTVAPSIAMGVGAGALAILAAMSLGAKRNNTSLEDPITWPMS